MPEFFCIIAHMCRGKMLSQHPRIGSIILVKSTEKHTCRQKALPMWFKTTRIVIEKFYYSIRGLVKTTRSSNKVVFHILACLPINIKPNMGYHEANIMSECKILISHWKLGTYSVARKASNYIPLHDEIEYIIQVTHHVFRMP